MYFISLNTRHRPWELVQNQTGRGQDRNEIDQGLIPGTSASPVRQVSRPGWDGVFGVGQASRHSKTGTHYPIKRFSLIYSGVWD